MTDKATSSRTTSCILWHNGRAGAELCRGLPDCDWHTPLLREDLCHS